MHVIILFSFIKKNNLISIKAHNQLIDWNSFKWVYKNILNGYPKNNMNSRLELQYMLDCLSKLYPSKDTDTRKKLKPKLKPKDMSHDEMPFAIKAII